MTLCQRTTSTLSSGELAVDDPGLPDRVAAALERRELFAELATLRQDRGMTQVEVAERCTRAKGKSPGLKRAPILASPPSSATPPPSGPR